MKPAVNLTRPAILICLLSLLWSCANRAQLQRTYPQSVPFIQTLVDRVSQEQYQKTQLDIEGMGLGLYGGEMYNMGFRNRDYHLENGPTHGNREACLYLQDRFTAMGLKVSLQGLYSNVVGELTGTKTPEKIYVIGAHYDHVEGDRPGGDDNASGTAAVLEAARVLSHYRFESTIRFICFNAEEDGLKGSKDYVKNHVLALGENIAGMINLDLILRPGSDVDSLSVIDAEVETQSTHPTSVEWVKLFQQAAIDYVPSLIVDDSIIYGESGSDNDPFLNNGFPAFLVIENSDPDWDVANPYVHNFEDASDRLANDPTSSSGVTYDYAFATDIIRTTVALLAQEAGLIPGTQKAESPDSIQSAYLNELKKEMHAEWPNNRTINLVFHGHSVPSGFFRTPTVNTLASYPYVVLKKIKSRYPYAVVNVINTAIGGENSVRGAERFDQDVLIHKPDVLFIDYALNDRGAGLEKSYKAWDEMIRKAVKKGIKVILLTPSPDQRVDYTDPNSELKKHSDQIIRLTEEHQIGLVDVYKAFAFSYSDKNELIKYMSQVNHPNEIGHELIADEIMKYF